MQYKVSGNLGNWNTGRALTSVAVVLKAVKDNKKQYQHPNCRCKDLHSERSPAISLQRYFLLVWSVVGQKLKIKRLSSPILGHNPGHNANNKGPDCLFSASILEPPRWHLIVITTILYRPSGRKLVRSA